MNEKSSFPRPYTGKLIGIEFGLEGPPDETVTLNVALPETGERWGPMPVTLLAGRWRVIGSVNGSPPSRTITLIEEPDHG